MPVGNQRSPFQEGFAFLREEPLLLAAELTWRWCFGIAACLIALCATAFFLEGLRLSALDRLLLGTMQPALAASALGHIFHGAMSRLTWIKLIVLSALTVLWALAAAVGHAASLRNLVALAGGEDHDEDAGWQFRPMFQLYLLRALWTWIAVGCAMASVVLGHMMLQQRHAARGAFFYVFGIALSLMFGMMLNRLLGLAPLFCIRNQVNAPDALSLTVDFCARQGSRLWALSSAFQTCQLFWMVAMFFVVFAPAQLGKHVAIGWQLLMMGFFYLIYLAGADALYLARLGAYCVLAEIDGQPTQEPETSPEGGPPPLTIPYPPIEGLPDECSA